jgi:hypothetical protein
MDTIVNTSRNYENCWVPNNFYSPSVAPTLGSQWNPLSMKFSKKRTKSTISGKRRTKRRSKSSTKRKFSKRKFSKRKFKKSLRKFSKRKSRKIKRFSVKKRRFSSDNHVVVLNKKDKQKVNKKLRKIKEIKKGRGPSKSIKERMDRLRKAYKIEREIFDIFTKAGYRGGRGDNDYISLIRSMSNFGSNQTKSPFPPGYTDVSGILLGPSAFQWENSPLDRALNA